MTKAGIKKRRVNCAYYSIHCGDSYYNRIRYYCFNNHIQNKRSLIWKSIIEEMEETDMNSSNEAELILLKERYDNALKDLYEFIDSGKSYKEMTIPEFKEQVQLFWQRSDLWKQALENGVYSKEKLDEDFEQFKMHAKRLLL